MKSRSFGAVVIFLSAAFGTDAAPSSELVEQIREYRLANELAILEEFNEFLSIPNDANDKPNITKNAEFLATMLERRGLETQLITVGESPPAVYAELEVDPEARTILLYSHYDGTPIEPEKWVTEAHRPTYRKGLMEDDAEFVDFSDIEAPVPGEWRIYARSASDEKLALMSMIVAIDALRSLDRKPSVNLKILFEGEEEQGSPHMAALLDEHKELLSANASLLCGGPVHSSRRLVIYFGARGNAVVDMTVYGASSHLHSGHYGNWAPNPIGLLTNLLASMRDEKGNILIDDFYDDVGPVSETERAALESIPREFDAALRHELGLAWNDIDNARLVERIMRPGINLGSIHAGPPRGTVSIPASAFASVGFRMVPDQTPENVRRLVETHVRKQGFHIVYEEPDLDTRREYPRIIQLNWLPGTSLAVRTSLDLPFSQALIASVEEVAGGELMKLPSIGSMAPMELFKEKLGAPVVILPSTNHDNNQHGPNENVRIQNLWEGIELFGNVFARIGELWQ